MPILAKIDHESKVDLNCFRLKSLFQALHNMLLKNGYNVFKTVFTLPLKLHADGVICFWLANEGLLFWSKVRLRLLSRWRMDEEKCGFHEDNRLTIRSKWKDFRIINWTVSIGFLWIRNFIFDFQLEVKKRMLAHQEMYIPSFSKFQSQIVAIFSSNFRSHQRLLVTSSYILCLLFHGFHFMYT